MTNNKQQTAVDWLFEQYKLIGMVTTAQVEKAKRMEKERMIQFTKQCLDKALDLDVRTAYSQVEKYYNETYEGGEQ